MLFSLGPLVPDVQTAAMRCGISLSEAKQDAWHHAASADLREILLRQNNPRFPCYFAARALEQGTLIGSSIDRISDKQLEIFVDDLRDFLKFYRYLKYRAALIAFVNTVHVESLEEDRHIFWHILNYVFSHGHGHANTRFEEPSWQFEFDGHALFFNGHSPHYVHRRSRYSPHCLTLIIQTKENLQQIAGLGASAASVSAQIRGFVDRYDDLPRSPYLVGYGSPDNCDWKQFWLRDDNEVDVRNCPLEAKTDDSP